MPRVRPITGATCNRFMAILHRARELAMDKLGVDLPRLTFPRFTEKAAGQYLSPAEFYSILRHVTHPTKRAFMELLYLLAIRPGQLKSTETNVRVEKGRPVALVYAAPTYREALARSCRRSCRVARHRPASTVPGLANSATSAPQEQRNAARSG